MQLREDGIGMVAMASLTLAMVVWMEEKSALIATCMCEDGINLISVTSFLRILVENRIRRVCWLQEIPVNQMPSIEVLATDELHIS